MADATAPVIAVRRTVACSATFAIALVLLVTVLQFPVARVPLAIGIAAYAGALLWR